MRATPKPYRESESTEPEASEQRLIDEHPEFTRLAWRPGADRVSALAALTEVARRAVGLELFWAAERTHCSSDYRYHAALLEAAETWVAAGLLTEDEVDAALEARRREVRLDEVVPRLDAGEEA